MSHKRILHLLKRHGYSFSPIGIFERKRTCTFCLVL